MPSIYRRAARRSVCVLTERIGGTRGPVYQIIHHERFQEIDHGQLLQFFQIFLFLCVRQFIVQLVPFIDERYVISVQLMFSFIDEHFGIFIQLIIPFIGQSDSVRLFVGLVIGRRLWRVEQLQVVEWLWILGHLRKFVLIVFFIFMVGRLQ